MWCLLGRNEVRDENFVLDNRNKVLFFYCLGADLISCPLKHFEGQTVD